MEEERHAMIPYIAHESAMARAERASRRQWISIILLIILLVGTNIAWLIYESQFEYYETTTVEQEADSEEGSIILNGTGEVTVNGYGETDGNNN